ncbi:MAG: hypothetical protein IKB42_04415 [Clostridia bacterium]|nr:hypothetical protein [Clostridia bacterium]
MVSKLMYAEYLNRDELYSCLYDEFENCKSVKVFRTLQDYSGNYDEIYNEYAVLNLKEVEQMLADFYLDNVLLEGDKNCEHIYYVAEPVSTYLKFEALRVFVYNQIGHKVYATKTKGEQDFVVFDDTCAVVLDFTDQGALKGGFVTTNKVDVMEVLSEYDKYKVDAVDYLKAVPCETSTKNGLNKKIKELKYSLKLDK